MSEELLNQVIIVTGAGSGIGRASALALAKEGAIVVAVGKSSKNINQTKKDITSLGAVCYPFVVNLKNMTEIVDFTKHLKKKFKKINWLINSAGFIEHEGKIKDFSLMFQVNCLAVIYLTRILSPTLKKNGGIINISSIAGIWPSAISPTYSASKAALNIYSRLTAQEFATSPLKLSCVAICPGRTNTPMRQKIAGDAKLYQSAEVVAKSIKNIITKESKFKNGDVVIVKNGRQRLHARL